MTENKIISRLKKSKLSRRKELAKLSFPEKILILVRLQEMFNSINTVKGKKRVIVWKI